MRPRRDKRLRRRMVAVCAARVCRCGRRMWSPQWADAPEGPPGSQATADHVVALCLGGESAPGNIEVICKTCNLRKGRAEHALFKVHAAFDAVRSRPAFLGGRR